MVDTICGYHCSDKGLTILRVTNVALSILVFIIGIILILAIKDQSSGGFITGIIFLLISIGWITICLITYCIRKSREQESLY